LIDAPTRKDGKSVEAKRRMSLPTRVAIGLLIILSASAIGTWLTAPPAQNERERAELFDRLSVLPDSDDPEFRANEPSQAERYIRDRVGMNVLVPRLDGGSLSGVSIREVANLQLPLLHLVDRSILDHIAEFGQVDVRNAPGFFRVTWRFRDDIYLAMQETTDPGLRDRFLFE
jgi:hypothetical protein